MSDCLKGTQANVITPLSTGLPDGLEYALLSFDRGYGTALSVESWCQYGEECKILKQHGWQLGGNTEKEKLLSLLNQA